MDSSTIRHAQQLCSTNLQVKPNLHELYRYQGHVSAALVLGGVDVTGPALYTVYPHGSTDKLPYVTMGSGSLAAMSVFEDGYKVGMNVSFATLLSTRHGLLYWATVVIHTANYLFTLVLTVKFPFLCFVSFP